MNVLINKIIGANNSLMEFKKILADYLVPTKVWVFKLCAYVWVCVCSTLQCDGY